MTLTAENCEAPVKTNSDNAQVCTTLAPAATEPTPNDTPKTPTAPLKVKQATTMGRIDGSRHQVSGDSDGWGSIGATLELSYQ